MPPRNRRLIPTDRSSTDRADRPCELAYEGFREGSAREFPSSSEYFAPSFFHERVLPERMGLLPSAREARPLAVPLNLGTVKMSSASFDIERIKDHSHDDVILFLVS